MHSVIEKLKNLSKNNIFEEHLNQPSGIGSVNHSINIMSKISLS
jgi:hypothetical protein